MALYSEFGVVSGPNGNDIVAKTFGMSFLAPGKVDHAGGYAPFTAFQM